MTDATETLDTLIDRLEQAEDLYFDDGLGGLGLEAARALTDLRTERDAALAVIEKVKEGVALTQMTANPNDSGAYVLTREAEDALFNAPITALADRDARILEEAADAIGLQDYRVEVCSPWVDEWLRARAVSRRVEAHEGDNTSHDSGSAS